MKKKTEKSAARRAAKPKVAESKETREMRESIEEMEGELAELDRDIAETKKGDKGEMSRIALENFQAMRKDIVEMIASTKDLYKVVLESEALEARLECEEKK